MYKIEELAQAIHQKELAWIKQQLWKNLIDELKIAETRKSVEGSGQSCYLLLEISEDINYKNLFFKDFLHIFYVGVAGKLQNRLNSHRNSITTHFLKGLPLNNKEMICNRAWEKNQKIVAVYLDDWHSNEALGIEYAIIFK
uniref:GIY-YIG domain-containing protein n=1 Tax=Rhabditophanes sp. KR3021 TaxID=114890 RepID=A0AC35U2R0_9BILA